MSKVNTPIVSVSVRRDANTITPTTVAKHEIPLLAKMFSKENVTVGDVSHVRELDTDGELERLSAKYGSEVVIAVYGDDGGVRLGEVMERNAVAATKVKKANKEATDTAAAKAAE